jgi:hypothetical protein
MDFLAEWFDNLQSRNEIVWRETLTINGLCKMHTGPSFRYASVIIEFSPSSQFIVQDKLSGDMRKLMLERDWYRYIVFGVLDIMLTTPINPIKNFRMSINQIDYNEIESSSIAFRLAARDAAQKALQCHLSKINI